MTQDILADQRKLWQKKPQLRAIYEDYYKLIVANCLPGLKLEIGGGSGNLKGYVDQVISTDIVPAPWLDAIADAQNLQFAPSFFSNIVGLDVLHHIERPIRFFREAERVLMPGGRIILVEPAITLISGFFYRNFHSEPVIMSVDPLMDGPLNPHRQPFDANQAIPTLIFEYQRNEFEKKFPNFKIVDLQYLSLIAYPLSGGFKSWCLIPNCFVNQILKLEKILCSFLGRLMGFRLLVVIEKLPDNNKKLSQN
jgi:SAM-dependent methyltransferase